MKRNHTACLLALVVLAAGLLGLGGCGGQTPAEPAPTHTVRPDPNPPIASNEPGGAPPVPWTPTQTPRPTETPTPTPAPTPEPTPSLRPGEYVGSDGSVLLVNADGTCTYETVVSGTVNGKPMSGQLTFHGTVEEGVFSFTKVTYFGLDLTAIAKSAGYEDASYWETAAAIIYGG